VRTTQAPERLLVDVPGHPGATLRVEVHHPDAPVTALFSSGLGLPLDLWHPVTDLLPDVRCVLFDRPGMGGSTPWHRVVDLPEEVDLLSTVLAATRAGRDAETTADHTVDPVVVVGHSHGGLFAEGLARTRPDVVRGLVLVDASDPGFEAARLQLGGAAATWAAWVAARGWLAPVAKDVAATAVLVGGAVRPASQQARDALVTAYGQPAQLEATVAELVAVGDDARALLDLATTHPLPDVPVQLVVATRAGRPTRHRRTAWLRRMTDRAAQLGPGTVRTDVDSGHLVMLDAPDAVARAVRACLTTPGR
jgi:pimeloyl-ACP methyl ester carboxylesterase